jgi:hypothetical protein
MRRLTLLLLLLPHALLAGAEDTVLTLGATDRFVIKDSSGEAKLILDGDTGILTLPDGIAPVLNVDNTSGAQNSAALVLRGSGHPPEKHPLVLYRDDTVSQREVSWFFRGGGSAGTPKSLTIDGELNNTIDLETGIVTVHERWGVNDPDVNALCTAVATPYGCCKGVGTGDCTMGTMLQLGSDVFTTTIWKAGAKCSTCTAGPRQDEPFHVIAMDGSQDWAFGLDARGKWFWGNPGSITNQGNDGADGGESGHGSWDVSLERVDDAGFEYLQATSDRDGSPVAIAIARPMPQGTGSAAAGGVLVWGDANTAAIDSGDEVCASVPGGDGLACNASIDPTDGSEHACGSPHPGTDATASGYFFALCY